MTAVLGSTNDTCILICILIKKYQVSSTFLVSYSISISITDTFPVYQYHKSLIHDSDTFTGIQNSLFNDKVCIQCQESHITNVT